MAAPTKTTFIDFSSTYKITAAWLNTWQDWILAHKTQHATGGADALSASDVGAFASSGNVTLADGKSVVFVKALGTDATYSGIIATETAGENLVFGDVCYRKSDGKFWKTDSDAVATMPARVMAVATIAGDAAGVFLIYGYVRNDAWTLTAGSPVYPSGTLGGITHTAPTGTNKVVQIIGEAISANPDIMFFSPDRTYLELT